ncbi:hypothetical protein [uncultured Draconibacterium sp.]|uniref:hypothetical protein n=1 Tax=uncultured Draconibacterium sp. TaxID=1573823 RepID=UPI003217E273
MKKLNNVLTAVALILISGAAMATGNLKVNIEQSAYDEAVVKISNVVESQFEVEIRNVNNDIVYYKQTQRPSKNLTQTFDFSRLRDGDYTLEVRLDNEQNLSVINIRSGKVTVTDQDKEVQPYFAFKNDRLDISYLNHEKDEVMLYVYDNKMGKLLQEIALGTDFALHSAVDFSKLNKGSYDAVLVSDDNVYEYNVLLKQ